MSVREFDLAISGFTGNVSAERLIVAASEELPVVTTAPLGAHLRRARSFFSIPAPSQLDCSAPDVFLTTRALALGILPPAVGFITAVKLERAVVHTERLDGTTVTAIATVGVSNSTRPGEEYFRAPASPGTINLIILIDGDLSPAALNESLTTAAEAKALAVYEGGAFTRGGLPATGTSTDAYAMVCSGRGPRHQYAGSVSQLGFLVGRAVRGAVTEGLIGALQRLDADT